MSTPARERLLRKAALPQVEALLDALVAQGLTRTKAASTIRWATYRLAERNDMEAPATPEPELRTFGGARRLRSVR